MNRTARAAGWLAAGWMMVAGVPQTAHAQVAYPPGVGAQQPRALSELLADASVRNLLPPDLIAYKARVQTEVAVLLRREEGSEAVAAIEDVASNLRWTRAGVTDQHVIGYRSQRTGFSISMLSAVRTGWLNPTLYGNRLRIRTQSGNRAARAAEALRKDGSDTLQAVHPLATDRDKFYTFSGGDTVVTMRTGARAIPIVHVRVRPREDVKERVLLFDGELDLDASRGALVRLRGHFIRRNDPPAGITARVLGSLVESVAFIEYENAERGEQYWLPSRQRLELQVASPLTGDGRAVIRIVSRFGEMAVNDTTLSAATLASADSMRQFMRRRLSYAPSDSLDRFSEWQGGIGALVEGMHSDDFAAIGPDRWRPTGPPRVEFMSPRGADVLHFNRVEGLFTGIGGKLSMRDLAPGVVARATVGYAWNEETVRGRLSVERTRGAFTLEARGGRTLDNTNDFRAPLDSGLSIFSVFGTEDPYDYVDRRGAALSGVWRTPQKDALLRLDLGAFDDRYRPATYKRGPLRGGDPYRANRGIDEGGYVRSAALVDWHPDVSSDFVKSGVGARVSYERGDGTLAFQRAETRLTARQLFGPFTTVARFDAGAVLGDRIPPQQLFELGSQQGLPGYADTEFVGSRAAIVRGLFMYTTPWLKQPLRITRRILFPGITPGASVALQSGWTELHNTAARESVLRFGLRADSTGALVPVATTTDGWRATVSTGLRFFSGSLFVGVARPIDRAGPWKSVISFGQQW